MSFRNLSPQQMFEAIAANHKPECRFRARDKKGFGAWQRKTLPRVIATLGDSPKAVPTNPQLLAKWTHDGLKKERWLIDVSEHISAICLINYPPKMKRGATYPTIFCCHGHGLYGKDPVMGNDSTSDRRSNIEQNNYNYGHVMAHAGYITYAIDWIGFGERCDSQKPNHRQQAGSRDWCNVYYLHATMLGMTSLSINLTHGRAATDFVCGLSAVDSNRLGVMGLSGGGTMTLWTALTDRRFKAAEIICYSDLWAHFGIRDVNYCGMQVTPGLYKLVDLPDLQGLLAPLPLLIDIGVYDSCFKVDSAMACFKQLERIYKTAGARDQLDIDLHASEHSWGGNLAPDFFKKHLGED